jgi:hypothetical protein
MDGTPSPASAAAGGAGATDARRRRRRVFTFAVVLAIVAVAVAAALLYVENTGPEIHIAAILVDAPDDVCGLGDEHIAYHGYSASGVAPTTVAIHVPNLNDTTCVVDSLVTNTTGFAVSGAKLPFTIPAGGGVSLSLSITPPARSYSGNLTLVVG